MGLAKVLSMVVNNPFDFAKSATPFISVIVSSGLDGVSMWINFVFGLMAALKSATS